MRKRRDKWTNCRDPVEVQEGANRTNGGDYGDRVLGELEDLSSEVRSLVSGVLCGHDEGGRGGETGRRIWVESLGFI